MAKDDGGDEALKEIRLCECGCGKTAPLAKWTSRKLGYIKGQPTRFLVGHRPKRDSSYKRSKIAANQAEAIHRLRAVRALGRPLPSNAIVHHADGSRHENAPLVICQDAAYHGLLHARMRVKAAGGNPNTDGYCRECKQAKPRDRFSPLRSAALGLFHVCKDCCAAYQRALRRRRAAA